VYSLVKIGPAVLEKPRSRKCKCLTDRRTDRRTDTEFAKCWLFKNCWNLFHMVCQQSTSIFNLSIRRSSFSLYKTMDSYLHRSYEIDNWLLSSPLYCILCRSCEIDHWLLPIVFYVGAVRLTFFVIFTFTEDRAALYI
jgi:hypothetical protein